MSVCHHLRVEVADGVTVVQFRDSRLAGELAMDVVGPELYFVASQPDCRKLVLDFSGVDFISSGFLGKLITVGRIVKEKGGSVRLCGFTPEIRMVFKVTALDRVFDIRDTAQDALAASGSA